MNLLILPNHTAIKDSKCITYIRRISMLFFTPLGFFVYYIQRKNMFHVNYRKSMKDTFLCDCFPFGKDNINEKHWESHNSKVLMVMHGAYLKNFLRTQNAL